MKKLLLLGLLGFSLSSFAQSGKDSPTILPEFYTMQISSDGNYILSDLGDDAIEIYDRTNGQYYRYEYVSIGIGNIFTDDGRFIGTIEGKQAFFKDGEWSVISGISSKTNCFFNGVTPDATRACGLLYNGDAMDETIQWRLPIYIDIKDGKASDIHILPHPEKDFFGKIPQYSSAVWISRDGKRILGLMIDNRGTLISPIVYTEDDKGEWTYSLPSESLFNPNHVEVPEFPGEFTLTPPDYKDYMTEEELERYQEAYDIWYASQFQGPYPEPSDYMSEENGQKFIKEETEYKEAALEYNTSLRNYYDAIQEILDTSFSMLQNGQAMDPAGRKIACAGIKPGSEPGLDGEDTGYFQTYIFDLTDNTYEAIDTSEDSPYNDVFPHQILSDGTVISSSAADGALPPHTYIIRPGSSEYESIYDYMCEVNPENAKWMEENLLHEFELGYDPETFDPLYGDFMFSGFIMASDDMDVISGGILAYLLPGTNTYMSYIMTGCSDPNSGISDNILGNTIVKVLKGGLLTIEGTVGNLSVYDLQGHKIFYSTEACGMIETGLDPGIYIITYTDKNGINNSFKTIF